MSRCLPFALVGCLAAAASACSDATSAQIVFDVDTSACPAKCAATAQLSIGRDGCLLTKYDAITTSGEHSLPAASVRPGDALAVALVLHCPAEQCATCVATASVTARDQLVVTLQPKPSQTCIERGGLPAVAGLDTCSAPDGGPPDTPTPRDSTVDRPPPLPDLLPPLPDGTGGTKSCSEVRDCGLKCGASTSCLASCQADACPAAVKPIVDLYQCAVTRCLACLPDFSQCDSCLRTKCSPQYATCTSNSC